MMKKQVFRLIRLCIINRNYQNGNQEISTKMIGCFLKQRPIYFDMAYIYHAGNSEEATVKKALSAWHDWDSHTIADKMPVWPVSKAADYRSYFNEQMEFYGAEYFHYYLLYALGAKAMEPGKCDAWTNIPLKIVTIAFCCIITGEFSFS